MLIPYFTASYHCEYGDPTVDKSVNKGVFQIFGVDIMIDQCLKPWIIEINSRPNMGFISKL
jgi:predicted ATP-grasp superfamily ATP-dependent carboligase